MTKNKQYWDRGNVRIQTLYWKLMGDRTAALNAFDSGEIDVIYNHIPVVEIPRLLRESKLKVYASPGTYYYSINVTKPPLNNLKVRQALALAMDRKYLTDKILMTGEKPASAFVPYGMQGLDPEKEFRTEVTETFIPESGNTERAKRLLSEAGYPDGKGFPEIELLYNADEENKAIAEIIKDQWNKNLGISLKLSHVEWKVLQEKMQNKDFTIIRTGNISEYSDPMGLLELMVSAVGSNYGGWSNSDYDRLIKQAKSTSDQTIRMPALHEAEKTLMKEMPIIPIKFYNTAVMVAPKLKKFVVPPMGGIYLQYAHIE